jgi:ATPase subunit of ABC transporter with duplicated ATPase domains
MLTLASVSKSYGTRTLFEEVSIFIKREDRMGLVGPNGAGKSTLFNLILGTEAPDSGSITWERRADYGHLAQETAPVGDETILDVATAITPEFAELRARVRASELGGSPACMEAEFEMHHRFDELGVIQSIRRQRPSFPVSVLERGISGGRRGRFRVGGSCGPIWRAFW